MGNKKKTKQRQTETDRDRQRQTKADKGRQRQTETDKGRQRQTETDRDRQRQTGTDTDRQCFCLFACLLAWLVRRSPRGVERVGPPPLPLHKGPGTIYPWVGGGGGGGGASEVMLFNASFGTNHHLSPHVRSLGTSRLLDPVSQ